MAFLACLTAQFLKITFRSNKSVGTRVNAGKVDINGGLLISSSNFHVGEISSGSVSHGFRIYALNVNSGGTVDINNKL